MRPVHLLKLRINYHPDLNAKEIDRHFSDIFPYARVEGEILPDISVKESPEGEATASVAPSEAAPNVNANGEEPALSYFVYSSVFYCILAF